MGREHYILDENRQVVPADLDTWARWFENGSKRRVRLTKVGKYEVSTVMLGIDHQWGSGPPLLFETMAFEGGVSGNEVTCERCSTWDQALVQHQEVVDSLKDHDAQATEEIADVVNV